MFDVVESLPVYKLLSTTYVDRCLKGSLPMDGEMGPIHSGPVPILDKKRDMSKMLSKLSHKESFLEVQRHAMIRVAKKLKNLEVKESHLIIETSRTGPMHTKRIRSDKPTTRVTPACGLREVRKCVLLPKLVKNFSKMLVTTPKIC